MPASSGPPRRSRAAPRSRGGGPPARPPGWAWRHRRLLFLAGLCAFTAGAGAAYLFTRVPLPHLPEAEQSTFLTDVHGQRLAILAGGVNRENVPLEKVPVPVRHAVLATEDKTFYDHSGLDPLGIARATWADIRGRPLQGGSTITQQYVKNVYLETRARTVARKLREAAYSIRLEREKSKDEIFEGYLNTVYFGRGAYGIQAASKVYFGKDVQSIGLREAAYLAGLIRSPVGADALKEKERAVADRRRSLTLRAMEAQGRISAAERAQVEAQPLESYVLPKEQAEPTFAMPDKGTQYFVEYVRQQLLDHFGGNDAVIYEGGLRVTTTLDLRMQAHAYDAVYGFLDREDDPAGALVAMDEAGHIRAMVGGRNWEQSKVNLAVGAEGGGSGRQPGSTFKPFVLAELVRQGYSVQSTLPGPAKAVFPKGNQGRDYEVENFDNQDFGDSVNLIDATANSVNTVYAQMIDVIGGRKVAQMATDAGITSKLVPDLSLTLGTSEVSVLEMARAYNTFATRGERVEPVAILEVRRADGTLVDWPEPPSPTRVLERRHADIVTYCLQQVVRRGSGTGARFGKPLAGKTGTTQGFGDAWFVGYTPKLTAAVWMGYPEGNVRKLVNVRGRKVNGGSFPAAMFKRFMEEATKDMDTGSFPTVSSFPGKPLKPSTRVKLVTTTTTTTTTTLPPVGSTTVPPPGGSTTTAPPPTSTTAKPPPSSTSSTTSTTLRP